MERNFREFAEISVCTGIRKNFIYAKNFCLCIGEFKALINKDLQIIPASVFFEKKLYKVF